MFFARSVFCPAEGQEVRGELSGVSSQLSTTTDSRCTVRVGPQLASIEGDMGLVVMDAEQLGLINFVSSMAKAI